MEIEKVDNIIVDTRKNVTYILKASRKLTREEMLRQIRYYNYNPLNIKTKPNSQIIIETDI